LKKIGDRPCGKDLVNDRGRSGDGEDDAKSKKGNNALRNDELKEGGKNSVRVRKKRIWNLVQTNAEQSDRTHLLRGVEGKGKVDG